jgi:FkbM family methyltransferase
MQTGDGFIFHLDTPSERPAPGPVAVMGWIAALQPIGGIRLLGREERPLTLLERADVRAAFPGHPHVAGFAGNADAEDFEKGILRLDLVVGGNSRRIDEVLRDRPAPLQGWRRWLALGEAAWAQARLGKNASQANRWNWGIRRLLAKTRLERGNSINRLTGDRILAHFADTFPEAVVVQIGANDGSTGDPLLPFFASTRWRAVLVEPIPRLNEALRARYAGRPEVAIERCAISDRDGHTEIFRLPDDPQSPAWFQQLASLDRSVLAKHGHSIPDIESRIVAETVPTLTVASLLRRHSLTRIDLLVIDTEGHDYRILRQFDLGSLRPLIVMFEHQHLSEADKAAAFALLRAHRYAWAETPEGDVLAWRNLDSARR